VPYGLSENRLQFPRNLAQSLLPIPRISSKQVALISLEASASERSTAQSAFGNHQTEPLDLGRSFSKGVSPLPDYLFRALLSGVSQRQQTAAAQSPQCRNPNGI
jgi:hypothetical protein